MNLCVCVCVCWSHVQPVFSCRVFIDPHTCCLSLVFDKVQSGLNALILTLITLQQLWQTENWFLTEGLLIFTLGWTEALTFCCMMLSSARVTQVQRLSSHSVFILLLYLLTGGGENALAFECLMSRGFLLSSSLFFIFSITSIVSWLWLYD